MKRLFLLIICILTSLQSSAQNPEPGQIRHYKPDMERYTAKKGVVLPDLLVTGEGKIVRNVKIWEKCRRNELLDIFSSEMYGKVPERPEGLHFTLTAPDSIVYDGTALRRRVRIYLDSDEKHSFDVLIHLPVRHNGKIPMFVGLNFAGNEETLGQNKRHWPFEMIVSEGFGVAEACHASIEPDGDEFGKDEPSAQVRSWYKPAEEWGAISAWAWGLSRIVDYLETCPEIDCSKVAVIGHSRLGKTALWASANDKRFALAISNCSGCCGAAISRRCYGETFSAIYSRFPYWFVPEFAKYQNNEETFPTDQHALIALSAPRPVYVASAALDYWADPEGEWMAAKEASCVYELYGLEGLSRDRMQPIGHTDDYGHIAYRIREGGHGLLSDDWCDYIKFAKRHFLVK